MRKAVLMLLLTLVSSGVAAEWVEMGKNPGKGDTASLPAAPIQSTLSATKIEKATQVIGYAFNFSGLPSEQSTLGTAAMKSLAEIYVKQLDLSNPVWTPSHPKWQRVLELVMADMQADLSKDTPENTRKLRSSWARAYAARAEEADMDNALRYFQSKEGTRYSDFQEQMTFIVAQGTLRMMKAGQENKQFPTDPNVSDKALKERLRLLLASSAIMTTVLAKDNQHQADAGGGLLIGIVASLEGIELDALNEKFGSDIEQIERFNQSEAGSHFYKALSGATSEMSAAVAAESLGKFQADQETRMKKWREFYQKEIGAPGNTTRLSDPQNAEVSAFIAAFEKGTIDYIKTYLTAYPEAINEPLRPAKTKAPLDLAVDFNRLELASYLISIGADVNRVDPKGVTPLHRAAYFNFSDMVTLLIKSGAKSEVRDYQDRTPLFYAAERGSTKSATALLEGGADVDSHNNKDIPRSPGIDQEQVTPLDRAIGQGHKDVALVLLQHGAKISIVDHFFHTPLDYAVQNPGWSDIVKTMLDRGAQCDVVRNGSSVIDKARDPETLRLLIDCIKKPAGKNANLSSALYLASGRGDHAFITTLIQSGADLDERSRLNGEPALFAAATGRAPEATIQLLVRNGANVNATDLGGRTVLHVLAFRYQPSTEKIIDYLLANGAGVNAAAAPPSNRSTNIGDTGFTPLHIAARNGQVEVAKILLARGAKVNALSHFRLTPLIWAVQNKHLDMVQLLLDNGGIVNPMDDKQPTPLDMAARSGEIDIVQMLLDRGADVNRSSPEPISSFTSRPLTSAIVTGNVKIAELLVLKGADVNLTDSYGRTPLNIAVKNNRLDLARLLVDHNADPELKDNDRYSAAMLAVDPPMRDLLAGGPHKSESRVSKTDALKVCHTVAALENTGQLKGKETPLASGEDFVGSPNDEWDMYNYAVKSEIRIGGAPYIVGRSNADLVYISRIGKDNVESLVCTYQKNGETVVVQTPIDRLLMAAKKSHYQNPVSYALSRPGTQTLEALLDGIPTEPALSFLKGPDGLTAMLYKAIDEHRADALKLLLDRGADPNPSMDKLNTTPANPKVTPITTALKVMESFSHGDATPLYAAAKNGNREAVRLLLEHGADPNIGEVYGARYAPLDPPARYQDKLMLGLLLKHGANPSSLGQFGVMQIVQYRKNDMLSLLFAYGLPLEAVRFTPSSFETYAIQQGNPDAGKIALAVDLKRQESECRSMSISLMSDSCVPRELRYAEDDLNRRYKQATFGTSQDKQKASQYGQREWLIQRNASCQLELEPATHDGWLSYVLSDRKTAVCVLEQTRSRAAFFAKNAP